MSTESIECGGCAPAVVVETERQADQRVADELRQACAASAGKPERVAVLTVMDKAAGMIHSEYQTTSNPDPSADLEKARAAVAELIEADKEFDAAYDEFPPMGAERTAIASAGRRINAARARRNAALARVQGGAA